ncbi:MAG: amino acid ABC transporter permease [Blautia sp.]|nr:amino acid ABC transporter permease [Blautia sp.]
MVMLDFDFITSSLKYVISAIPMTLLLTFVPLALGLFIGIFLCLIRIKKVKVASFLVSVFYSFFRSCPLIVIIYLFYYGMPKIINMVFYAGVKKVSVADINNVTASRVAMTLYSAAFLGEIMRGAILSVGKDQYEGAYSLGLSKAMTFRYIVLPQAFRIALPNICSFCLGLLKGSSVVFGIGVVDMMAAAKIRAETGYRYIEAYLLAGMIYLILVFVIDGVFKQVSKHFARGYSS